MTSGFYVLNMPFVCFITSLEYVIVNIETFASNGIVGELANIANESVMGAVEVASLTNLTELAAKGMEAFNDSFVAVALIGGIIMLFVSLIVYILIPKSLDITKKL